MPPADPIPPADDFPAGQTGDMRDVLLSPQTEAKPATATTGPWQPPSAEELQKLLPQYEITALLGRGGMGAVYKGRQIALDRPVAIKILSNTLEEADASFAERFKNEARALGKLSHPGIVGVYDFGEAANGLLYIVMEFIDGTDVSKMLAQQKRLHTEHAMAITAHVCDALAYAHERGIIHRDIKPANIMVSYDGVVKVADFGLAKMINANAQSGLTQSGLAMGTLHYMAPEALMLGSAVDHRADIYAVGVMLYQMLTGKLPQGLFEMPSLQVPGLDPRYDGIISKAMREDREMRYPRVLDMRHDLDAILTQPVVKVEPSAEKAPAALQTQARPQRPAGQPYRPSQPGVIVRTEKRGSFLLWAALLAVCTVVAWFFLKERGNTLVNPSTIATTSPVAATKEKPFVNSLGMRFVPIGSIVSAGYVCVHETRKRDYAAFAAENPEIGNAWKVDVKRNGEEMIAGADNPVVFVSWHDAQAFCRWLTKKEGRLYRLPTDREWSALVGVGRDEKNNATPADLSQQIENEYPWGKKWPPPAGAGNYADSSTRDKFPNQPALDNYTDGFPATAPVMSFEQNRFGVYDLGGNVSEWCDDWYDASQKRRVLRGGSWFSLERTRMLSSHRYSMDPAISDNNSGFRCIMEDEVATSQVVANASATTGLPLHPPPNTTQRHTDLLAQVDLKRDVLIGNWKTSPDGIELEAGSDPESRLDIPFTPPAEYDFEIEFTTTVDRVGSVTQCFTAGGRAVIWTMQSHPTQQDPVYGFYGGKGTKPEAMVGLPRLLKKGQRYHSVVRVRKGSLQAQMDGEELLSWKGDIQRFPAKWDRWPSAQPLGIGSWGGGIVFHKATITEFVPQPATSTLPAGPTTWTDTKGRSITATFKALASGNVLLDIAGKVTLVPLNTLSAASQKLARDYEATAPARKTGTSMPALRVPPTPELVRARASGGKLRASGVFGPSTKSAPVDASLLSPFGDFIAIDSTASKVFALRASGVGHTLFGQDGKTRMLEFPGAKRLFRSLIWPRLGTSDTIYHNATKVTPYFKLPSPPVAVASAFYDQAGVFVLCEDGSKNWYSTRNNDQNPIDPKDYKLPPQDSISSVVAAVGMASHIVFLKLDGTVFGWSLSKGSELVFAPVPSSIVEIDGGGGFVVALTAEGVVLKLNNDGTTLDASGQDGPFVSVRAFESGFAAQRPNGTWKAWCSSPEITAKVEEIGFAIDLDIGWHKAGNLENFVVWISP